MNNEDSGRIVQCLEELNGILEENTCSKTSFVNEVEITNDNAKGETKLTIKGRSDKSLETLIKEVKQQWDKTVGELK